MIWANVYKAGLHPESGLLVSSYYVDFSPSDNANFWDFAVNIRDFDMAFEGNQTDLLLITAQSTGTGEEFAGAGCFAYAPLEGTFKGAKPVAEALPWRWCLNVGMWGGRGRPSHHWHHYAVGKDEIEFTTKGRIAWKAPRNMLDIQNEHFRQYGGNWPQWLRIGRGNATPGQAFTFDEVREVMPVGVSLMNKARRRQALIPHQAIDLEARSVRGIAKGAQMFRALMLERGLDLGDYINPEIRAMTTSIIGTVVGLAQMHKDNNKAPDGNKLNDGRGWDVRFGPTGQKMEDQFDKLDTKRETDLKYLQKFKTFNDVSGVPYFHKEDAEEWFKAGYEWAGYLGAFGGFDFTNPAQQPFKQKERLDNYTPWYPDLPTRIDGLPKPTFEGNHKTRIPDLIL